MINQESATQDRVLTRTEACHHPDLRLSSSRTLRNKSVLFISHPVYSPPHLYTLSLKKKKKVRTEIQIKLCQTQKSEFYLYLEVMNGGESKVSIYVLGKQRKAVTPHFIMLISYILIDKSLRDSTAFCFFAKAEAWEFQLKLGTQCIGCKLLGIKCMFCLGFSPVSWKVTQFLLHLDLKSFPILFSPFEACLLLG